MLHTVKKCHNNLRDSIGAGVVLFALILGVVAWLAATNKLTGKQVVGVLLALVAIVGGILGLNVTLREGGVNVSQSGIETDSAGPTGPDTVDHAFGLRLKSVHWEHVYQKKQNGVFT